MLKFQSRFGVVMLLGCLVSGVSFSCWADSPGDWYAGVSAGQSSSRNDHASITRGLLNGGITTGGNLAVTDIADNSESNAYQWFGGYRVSSWFAVEGGYYDLGKLGFTATTNPAGTFNGVLKNHGVYFDGLASYAVDQNTAVFFRGGVTFNQAQSDFSGAGAVQVVHPDYSANSTGYHIGLGGSRRISDALELRLQGERYRLDDSVNRKEVVSLISIGLLYNF